MVLIRLLAFVLAGAGLMCGGGEFPAAKAPRWSVHEIALKAASQYPNPYLEAEVDAVFTYQGGAKVSVRGFWDGGTTFKLRFTPTAEGRWTFLTRSADSGLNGWKGAIDCTRPAAGAHGFVRRDAEYPQHWLWDDGTRYFMVGQTYYEIISNARAGDSWKTAVDECARYGINKVRFRLSVKTCNTGDNQFPCAMPWDADPDHLDLAHWRATDAVVEYMNRKAVVADLMPFNSMERAFGTPEQDTRFLRYVIARYAAYPNVIWCLTNEFQRTGRPLDYLNTLGVRLRAEDPWLPSGKYLRPLSIHPLGGKGKGDRYLLGDQQWPVHVILQTGRGNPADPELNADTLANRKFGMPVVNDEFGYMGDSLGAWGRGEGYKRELHRNALWAIYMGGGYASTGDKNRYADGRPYKSSIWHEQPEYGDVANLVKLFTGKGLEYWKMTPDNSLAVSGERVYILANPGQQYIAYAAVGGKFALRLPEGEYSACFFNPRDGSEKALPLASDGIRSFDIPAGCDWAVYLRRRAM